MSSKPIEAPSIASRLVLLFTLAAAFLLSCALGVFYVIVVSHAVEEDNAVLADKLSALRGELEKEDWTAVLAPELTPVHAGEPSAYWIRVINSTGATVVETPGMENLLPRQIFPSERTPDGMTLKPKSYQSADRLWSLLTVEARTNGQPCIIQLAQDRSGDERFLKEFRILLLCGLGFGIAAAALIAMLVTRHGLRPLLQMAQSVKKISPSRLDERLARARWPHELQPLAEAFDDMLSRLEDSFTRLSQFSADLAHELRTPVANLLGEAQVALTRARTPNEYREVIESNVVECQRLSDIIDSLLFLARAETAEQQVRRQHFDGRAAIEKIAAFYEAIADERNIRVGCSGEGEFFADPVLFERAVGNLVANALRFTRDNGSISISIARQSDGARVIVEDTGVGIAAKHIPRVFDRFYRVEEARGSDGTGLGLALVKSIADLHSGTVQLVSVVGRGTTVTLDLPDKPDPKFKT